MFESLSFEFHYHSSAVNVRVKVDTGLDLMERDVNGEEIDWYGYRPNELLNSLLSRSDRWVLIFEPYFDQKF